MKYILLFTIIIIFSITSCSELRDNINEPAEFSFHPEGIEDPSSPNFHGKLIRNNGWNMQACLQCHRGGFSSRIENNCTDCHDQSAGPENCSTCHGSPASPAPPQDLNDNIVNTARGVGAHQVHLAGMQNAKSVSCTECHIVPAAINSPGHLDPSAHAEVIMKNYLANLVTNDPQVADPVIYDPTLPVFRPDPFYDTAVVTCSNTYCHGSFKNGNPGNITAWNIPGSAECGSCHGDVSRPTLRERALPRTVEQGGTHPGGLQCHLCHDGLVDQNLKFINISKHIDGKVNFLGSDYKY